MMTSPLIAIRNAIIKPLYKGIVKSILFQFDPEKVHDMFIKVGKFLGSNFFTRWGTSLLFGYSNPSLKQTVAGITFENPLGLAAGFDKDAKMIKICRSTGFGYTEIGSVTGEPCEGNPKPRLWRLKESKGLVVYYGLKNGGAEVISQKLKTYNLPVGISVAKTNCQATADKTQGIKDYVKAFTLLHEKGDYMVINISCPNAFGGQPFTNKQDFSDLLTEIAKVPTQKPVFIKLAPDLSEEELDNILEVCGNFKIAGFICTNLTKDRRNEDINRLLKEKEIPPVGGVSGLPIRDLSTKVVRHIYKKTQGKYVIIGCGGIFSAEDAYAKIKAGASLLQLITGMIFEGPQIISEINRGLVELLRKDGYTSISEAVGKDNQ